MLCAVHPHTGCATASFRRRRCGALRIRRAGNAAQAVVRRGGALHAKEQCGFVFAAAQFHLRGGTAVADAAGAEFKRRVVLAQGGGLLLERIDDLMLMSIRPGWSGQTLNEEIYPRLEAARSEIDRRGLDVDLEIDGGVKVDNARRAVDAGANVLIAASGLFGQADVPGTAERLAEIAREGRRAA